MTLLLVRHGQTDWNLEPARCQGWADVSLNETGRAQARDAGREVAGRGIELVVTSHLLRARETAGLIRAELADGKGGAPELIVDPRFAEAHRGDWETRLFSEIIEEEPNAWRAYREHPETFRFPAGESLAGHQRRVLAALRDCLQDGRRTLVVTHGGSIRLLRCFLDGAGLAAFHATKTQTGGIDEVDTAGLEDRVSACLSADA